MIAENEPLSLNEMLTNLNVYMFHCIHNLHVSHQSTLLHICVGPCYDGEIRLEGANYDHEGRVQICYDNTWGTVCDVNWGINEATVVCTQLGFLSTGRQ